MVESSVHRLFPLKGDSDRPYAMVLLCRRSSSGCGRGVKERNAYQSVPQTQLDLPRAEDNLEEYEIGCYVGRRPVTR